MINTKTIAKYLSCTLEKTDFDFLGKRIQGKVRDVYDNGEHLFLITTDRYSAFDRNLALVPLKGQVLAETSIYNFSQTEDIIKNHIIAHPDPNVIVCKKCTVAPVEVIVRGYITGVTDTALWTRYKKGQRKFDDFVLPDGMVKNQKLDKPVVTPTTKFEEHDRNLTESEIISEGHLTQEKWEEIKDIALQVFARGQKVSKSKGLILVDTKYEFGYDDAGGLTLIDEVHTQDSSRYWMVSTYEELIKKGEEPEYFDKEFLRLWFRENCDPYKDEILPEAPKDMLVELSSRYIHIYETLSGKIFKPVPVGNPAERIEQVLRNWG